MSGAALVFVAYDRPNTSGLLASRNLCASAEKPHIESYRVGSSTMADYRTHSNDCTSYQP